MGQMAHSPRKTTQRSDQQFLAANNVKSGLTNSVDFTGGYFFRIGFPHPAEVNQAFSDILLIPRRFS
jgi:hypothetical protein